MLLGIDFETTGLDVKNDLIIEVGAVLWDTNIGAPVFIQSDIVQNNVPIPDEITKITGITGEMVQDYGLPPTDVFKKLWSLIKSSNAVVAHNGTSFDKPMLQAQTKRLEWEWIDKPWIDTSIDVPYPEKTTTRKLVHLAAEHGFLNPFAHRAVFDVLTMLAVLKEYDLGQVVKLAGEPNITVKALVSYDDREQAKSRGYRWDAERKSWVKNLKQSQLVVETEKVPFKIVELA